MRLALALSCLLLAACEPTMPADTTPARMKVPVGSAPVLGPADAWVTVVVFADLECPHCAAEHPVLLELARLQPADVRLVWKHFPLPAGPHSRSAAIATECARAQGRFWEMADLVFQHRSALLPANLASYALQAGCSEADYSACIAGTAAAAAVNADRAQGLVLGVQGTPTVVVNGQVFVGAHDLATLRAAVEAARAAAIASGVPRADYYDRVVLGP
ncbi:MAG: DsbA family protein [Deltaproteobacteria bacterium]|nr:DsbA family protein [Deltaproteobacteria bacterium]